MSVYNVNGTELSKIYSTTVSLNKAYDIDGDLVFGTDDSDYNEYSTEYQHTILQARDAWKTEYRADETIVPLILTTDQHQYLNSAHKPTFDYLGLAIKWNEISASLNLGDVCGAVYTPTTLNAMLTCLSSIPKAKQINVAGNHDVQLNKEEGSSYAYAPLTDELFHTLQETYFNNSSYGGNQSNVRYGFKGMESVVDDAHHIKFCIFAIWYTRGNPWYQYYAGSEAIEAMISMLSSVDDNDIIVLSHIQPYKDKTMRFNPAVDGKEASHGESSPGNANLGYNLALDQLFSDRKAKRSGSIDDIDGVSHSYDFTGCTSDLLCCLSGHSHTDYTLYDPDGKVPAVVFDAYRYDNVPAYFVNVDRTRQRLNVWKFDQSNNIYNFQVPFDEPEVE